MLRPEFGPEVADQVRLAEHHALTNGDQWWKLRLRSSCQPGCSDFAHSGSVGVFARSSTDDGRALEHVELLGISAEVRNQLHAGRAGADERDTLVRQLVQAAARVAAGVVVIPARGVEDVALEVLDAGDAGQLRPVVRALRHDHEAGPDVVTAVGADPPALESTRPSACRVPGWRTIAPSYRPKCFADAAAVLEDLGAVGELLRRHEAELFEQRDVAVRVVVALDPREAIPVPDAAEVAGHLDDPDVLDTGLLQVRPGQQSGESPAEDRRLRCPRRSASRGVTGV